MIDTLHIGFIIDFVRGLYAGTAFRRKVGENTDSKDAAPVAVAKKYGWKRENDR